MALCSLSDAELWTLILNDDYRAFTALYQRHWRRMYVTAIKHLHDEEASEEVVHDLFLNIWNRRASLVINNFESYFKVATRYQVYAYLKKQKEAPVLYMEHASDHEKRSEQNRAEAEITYRELQVRLNNQLKLLPLRCQEIFLLSRVEHFTNNEIAQKLGINKRTVENQITHALQLIRLNMKNILSVIAAMLSYLVNF